MNVPAAGQKRLVIAGAMGMVGGYALRRLDSLNASPGMRRRKTTLIIVRFNFPATTNAAYLQDVKDDFDVLYAEAAQHTARELTARRKSVISDRTGRGSRCQIRGVCHMENVRLSVP